MGYLGFCFFLYSTPNLILADGGQALPVNWEKIFLSKMKVRVIDGDTFDADIDRNGLFSNPEERVRLLAILKVRGYNVNLALIRHGHSYFDTRYSWPEGFRTNAMAEAHAFVKRIGI